jgi:dihydroneopterin aldolase
LDAIEIRGLQVSGTHGVLPEERSLPQPFEVDLDLELDLRPAGLSDDLADTVDYGAVADSVAAVVGGEHADLLEHLAERIARAVVASAGAGRPVKSVTVAVRKLRPPVKMSIASAGVRIQRRSDELADTREP